MSQRELDEAVSKIRSVQVSEETVKAAAGRVFRSLFDSAFIATEPSGKIRGCADVRSLIPAYLNRTLSGPRSLLLEDHILGCVDCRHALHEARSGSSTVRPIPIARPRRTNIPMLVWAAAATLVVGVGLGLTGHLPGQNTLDATVASVQGTLYKVTDYGVSLVKIGEILKNTDELRTAKGSHAILRLAGGAVVEIAERSDVSLSGGWGGTKVNLQRGQMIVDTNNQSQNALYVYNGNMTIPVRDGVVALDHGTKESGVAVASGSVEVQQSGYATQSVPAGHELYGGHLRPVNLQTTSEFAWSQNSASYLALLQQFSAFQKDLQAIPGPDLRYATQLAQYLPADTFLYAAIPNLGGTISEAKKLFDSRLAESDVLRQWWQQQSVSKNGEFDQIVDRISSFASYLGNEIVVSVGGDVSGSHAGPVFLAQISQPGLAEYLQSHLPANAPLQIVTAGTTPADNGKLLVDFDNNVLVATPSAAQLQRVEAVIQQRAAGGFTGTPFYSRIDKVYRNGAGAFLAANLEQITAKSVNNAKANIPPGFENIQYLVLERKQSDTGGEAEMRAAISFDGSRHGIASWLGTPGPAGSLDFVSPEASFAASMVMKSPRAMMQELLDFAGSKDPAFTQGLADFEAHAGVNLLNDVAAPLGSDVTFAVDGALVPIPAWKLVIEVNDPTRLQSSLEMFKDRFNQQATEKTGQLQLTREQVNGRTFYTLSSTKAPGLGAHYTFVNGYLLACSSEADVVTAIQNKQAGHTLTTSGKFLAKLPADGYPNFSAMVYSNLAPSLGDVTKQLNTSGKQQQVLTALLSNSGPGLVCVYGEPDRITAAAKGSFLGFDLGTLIGIQEGKPLKTMIATAPTGAKKGIVN